MLIDLPTQIERRLTKREAALHFSIGLFVDEETTLGQSAEIAGMSQSEFLRELGRRRIPIHYGVEELNADLATVAALATA